MKIKSEQLKTLMQKSIKGALNHKLIPITGFIMVRLADKHLTLTTTDGVNILEVSADAIEGKDLYAVVVADTFNRLIGKTTSEFVNMEITEKGFEVKGNGTYIFEMPLDEDGKVVTIARPDFKDEKETAIDLEDIKGVLYSNKSAVAETFEVPALTGYYADSDGVVTADGLRICKTNNKLFFTPALLSADLINLLSVFDTDDIKASWNENEMIFRSKDTTIYGRTMNEIADYPIDSIKKYFHIVFENSVKLNKNKLLEILDRLSIFTEGYDKSVLEFSFENTELTISDKEGNIWERVKYESVGTANNFTCNVDINLLTPQVRALDEELFELHYGLENAVMLTTANIKQIISLSEEA